MKKTNSKLKSFVCVPTKTMSNLSLLSARITTVTIVYWAHTIPQDHKDSVWSLPKSCVMLFWVHACAPSIPTSAKSVLPPFHVTQVRLPIKLPVPPPWGEGGVRGGYVNQSQPIRFLLLGASLEWRQVRAKRRCCLFSQSWMCEPAFPKTWFCSFSHFMSYPIGYL